MKKGFDIIHEDENIVGINKPAGMLSVPDRMQSEQSLKDMLQDRYGKIFVVHRLDKETSGVIVFAKNEEAHKDLSLQFENRETAKYYSGLVIGKLADKSGMIEKAIIEHPNKKGMMVTATKGKPSVTGYEVVEEFTHYSFMRFNLLTGRTHQIRVHMNYLGHPLVCDPLYGDGKPVLLSAIKKRFKLSKSEEAERPILGRLALHSEELHLRKLDGSMLTLHAELPKDLRAVMQQLRKLALP